MKKILYFLLFFGVLISCKDEVDSNKMYINCDTDFSDCNSILFLCESASVPSIERKELCKYLIKSELDISNEEIKKNIYKIDYKVFDTLSTNSTFSTVLLCKVGNEDRDYDFSIRTYNSKTKQLIDSQVFASWKKHLSGAFDKTKLTFQVIYSDEKNEYLEYKIDADGKIIEIE